MTVYCICGEMGVGKTLTTTFICWKNWFEKRKKIYSNYHLFKIPYMFIDSVDKMFEMKDGFVAIDELWRVADCVTPDTYVMTENSVSKIIDSINENPIQSVNFDNMSLEKSVISHQFKRPVKFNEKLVKINTPTKQISTSKNHRFFCFDGINIKEKYAKNITNNDYVLTVNKIKSPKKQLCDPILAKFLGYVFGDGTIYYTPQETHWTKRMGVIRLHDSDRDLLKKYGKIMKKKYGLKYYINKSKQGNYYRMTITNRKFIENEIIKLLKNDKNCFLDKWGLRFRDIPELIIKSNNEVFGNFLSGLFDAEGHIRINEEKSSITADKKSIHTRIELSMVSHIDMEKLKHLLLRFGIRTTNVKKIKNKEFGNHFIYNFSIRDRISILNFYENIGFLSNNKQKVLCECVSFIQNRKNKFNKSRLYPMQSMITLLLDKICKDHKLTISKIEHNLYGKYHISYIRKNKIFNISESKLTNIINAMEKEYGKYDEIEFIKKLLSSDIIFEKVKETKLVKPNYNYLYDLSVPTHENYIANGFIVHNSRLSKSKKNKIVNDILSAGRKKHLVYVFTAQVLHSIDKRIRDITDITSYPQLNMNESGCRVLVFNGGYVRNMSGYSTKYYFVTKPIFDLYDTDEIVEMPDSTNEQMKIVFQENFIRDHGYFCQCEHCNTKFFDDWLSAENYADAYWKKMYAKGYKVI